MLASTLNRGLIVALSLALAGCDRSEPLSPSGSGTEKDPASLALSITRGEVAFVAECASCHATRDGFDLAFFQMPDSTIIRRAAAHVPKETGEDIAAYIRSLDTETVPRHDQPFQPTGAMVVDDHAFAISLFGMDGLPADLDTEALKAIDPLQVSVAVEFPEWSIEGDNLDWMPDQPLPDEILDDRESLARGRLARYYANPTTENLAMAVVALRGADRRRDSATAPCIFDDPTRFEPLECFETRRWTSSLVGQHMLRNGMSDPIHSILHDTWWDVGNAARKSVQFDRSIENGEENWASWMYLGWAFDPGGHASIYTGSGLQRQGLPRHATFVALKSIVSRREGSRAIWPDARSAAQFAPRGWAFDATRIAYEHLLERLDNGERPTTVEGLEEARMFVDRAFNASVRKVTMDERVALDAMRAEIQARLE